jgi:hypothetical protein
VLIDPGMDEARNRMAVVVPFPFLNRARLVGQYWYRGSVETNI